MNPDQMEAFRASVGIRPGEEWEAGAGLDIPSEKLQTAIEGSPFYLQPAAPHESGARRVARRVACACWRARCPTQEAFGRILVEIAREGGPLADRIVTASPDVTVSTGLGGWVNRRGIFAREVVEDVFRKKMSYRRSAGSRVRPASMLNWVLRRTTSSFAWPLSASRQS